MNSRINPAFQKYLLPDPDDEDDVHLLDRAIAYLDNRKQKIVRFRYFDHLTYMEIARKLKVSSERVRQIDRKILHQLKKYLTIHGQ